MEASKQRSYGEFVGAVADVLDTLQIEYGFAGSFASGQYGEPRQTLDADLTVHLRPEDAGRFASAFQTIGMFADPEAICDTFGYRDPLPFGVIDPSGGWKADCYLLRDTAYERTAFSRRRELPCSATRHCRHANEYGALGSSIGFDLSESLGRPAWIARLLGEAVE